MSIPLYHTAYEAAEAAITEWGHEIDVATGFEEASFNGKSRLLELGDEPLRDINPLRPRYLGRIAAMQAELSPPLSDRIPSTIELTCEHVVATPFDDDDAITMRQSYMLFQQHSKNFTIDLAAESLGHAVEQGEDTVRDLSPEDIRFTAYALASIARHYPLIR